MRQRSRTPIAEHPPWRSASRRSASAARDESTSSATHRTATATPLRTEGRWIDYSVDGRRYRESSKSRKKSDAVKLLKQRLGQTPEQASARAQKLTFEDLEAGIVAEYQREGRRSA